MLDPSKRLSLVALFVLLTPLAGAIARADDGPSPPAAGSADTSAPVAPPGHCALYDPHGECPADGASSMQIGFELDLEQMRGLKLVPYSGGSQQTSNIYGSGTGAANPTSPPSLTQIVPNIVFRGETLGFSFSPVFLAMIAGPGVAGFSVPLETEIHHRFGWFEPALGADVFYAHAGYVEDTPTAESLNAVEIAGRFSLRAWLTPSVSAAAWAERSIAGTYPMSAIGFGIGGYTEAH